MKCGSLALHVDNKILVFVNGSCLTKIAKINLSQKIVYGTIPEDQVFEGEKEGIQIQTH